MLAAVREALPDEQIILPHVLGVFQIAVFTLPMSRLLACLEQCSALWALPQPGCLSFKTPKFSTCVVGTCTCLLG